MFRYSGQLQRILRHPPHKLARKAAERITHRINCLHNRRRDLRTPTYSRASVEVLNSLLSPLPVDLLRSIGDEIASLADHYLAHRFDLLGSGWVQVCHGMRCRGLEGYRYDSDCPVQADTDGGWLSDVINPANLPESQRIWRLIDPEYLPIDWHLDFKSGYRWSENTWYGNIAYGHKPGVDVKIPWELARCQHLPQLAFAYALAKEDCSGFDRPEAYTREFRSQILDFIATNPPRLGVNWHCTMDVAIQAANWLVSYDVFRACGAEFDEEFTSLFARSIYEHGLHIIGNFEWKRDFTNNHYLSDIVGLLFISAYLPRSAQTDAWLAFSVQELISTVNDHFTDDGANFEGSTSYHRLSAELVIYATALVIGLPQEKQKALLDYNHRLLSRLKPAPISLYQMPEHVRLTPFPDWYLERLEKMAEFTMHITKPNGHITQIGDNDSGRFLKLQPAFKEMIAKEARQRYLNLEGCSELPDDAACIDEDILDHRHLVSAINGLFDREDFAAFAGDRSIDGQIIRQLSGGVRIPSYRDNTESGQGKNAAHESVDFSGDSWSVREFKAAGDDLLQDLKLYAYKDFGLYIYRSKRLYLSVRCGKIGLGGLGAHDHNDQLSVELCIDGEELACDPGTYVYTPLPELRNKYRSVNAHFAPKLRQKEQAGLEAGVFTLHKAVDGICISFDKAGLLARHRDIELLVRLKKNSVILAAKADKGKPVWETLEIPYSNGYGKLLRNERK